MATREEKVEAFTRQLMSEGWGYAEANSRARAAYSSDGWGCRTSRGLPDEPSEAQVDEYLKEVPPPSPEFRRSVLEAQATATVDHEGTDPEELRHRERESRRTRICLCGKPITKYAELCHQCENRRRHDAGVYDDCERNTVFANPRRGA